MSTVPTPAPNQRILIWGAQGWIGSQLFSLLKAQGATAQGTTTRLHEQAAVRQTLDEYRPTHVINCAGKTGRPNVDWCESHKLETMESNALGTLLLAYECEKRGVHCTVVATGCIYTSQYSENRSELISRPFTEDDPPNFTGSFYSLTKAPVETFLKHYPNVLILRLRMPVSADLSPRSFVTKIKSYPRIVSIPNSHSLLPELLPITLALSATSQTGVYNFTNPGSISHNEVLELYREIVEPGMKPWTNFTLEEQRSVIVAERSNCALDAGKLVRKVQELREMGWKGLVLREVREAYRACFEELKKGLQQKGGAQQVDGEGARQGLPVP